MTTDLEDRVTRALHAEAAAGGLAPPPGSWERVVASAQARRGPRRARTAVAAARLIAAINQRSGHRRPVIQRREEEGLVHIRGLSLVKLDGDGRHTLEPLRRVAKRMVRVSRRPIEVVRLTVREHCEWIEP